MAVNAMYICICVQYSHSAWFLDATHVEKNRQTLIL